ncbi:MAG: hypothetical protein IPJ00_17425 [Saprospirales bacterium]|nr:hypothetical protein [Saprospirales bacterium]
MPECDVYDIERNALTFPGGLPIVAHPPCRSWGKLKFFSNGDHKEKQLALWAVRQIRKHGGVLEHPEGSSLWKDLGLPCGTQRDKWGGHSLSVDQSWFGHRARKRTWLYIVGVEPSKIPPYTMNFQPVMFNVNSSLRKGRKLPEISKAEREATPPDFARWLVALAKSTSL